jgi:hypothetical protein
MNRPWIFILLAFGLIIYLWVPTLLMLFEDKHAPETDEIIRTTKPAVTRRPSDEYSIIAERNLIRAPQQEGSAPSEEKEAIMLEGIPVAEKDLGLTLVGTVLTDDPNTNIAFIYSRSTRQQEPYQKGDRIGEVSVKRILWDKVVIETERGEEVLVMLFEGTAGSSLHSSTDLEPTVSSGPLYGGSPSSVGAATRDGGNAAAESSGSALGRGSSATYGGGSLRSSRSSSENSSSSFSESEEGESSLTDPEPTVSSGPL